MRNFLFIATLTLSFFTLTADLVHAQQIGATALPLSTTRIGLEAGGYFNRGASTGAFMRVMRNFGTRNAFELGAGGSTGDRGSRAMMAVRREVMREDLNAPSMALRFSGESYGDSELSRRNAGGLGLLVSKGFVAGHQEFYSFLQPRMQVAAESTSNEFVMVSAVTMGLNANLGSLSRPWIASLEYDLGLENAGSSFMIGIATDI